MPQHKYVSARTEDFQDQFEKHRAPEVKFGKFEDTLLQAPRKLKNAHPLHGLKFPFWAAHFRSGLGLLVVVYTICDDGPNSCYGVCDRPDGIDCRRPSDRVVFRSIGRHDAAYSRLENIRR
jgi:hypothetical protein